jgi:hypothetical protein
MKFNPNELDRLEKANKTQSSTKWGSVHPESDDSGLQLTGYVDKKGTPVAHGAEIGYIFNKLPPGMDITEQDVADIRDMELKRITPSGYPGSGWDSSGPIKGLAAINANMHQKK